MQRSREAADEFPAVRKGAEVDEWIREMKDWLTYPAGTRIREYPEDLAEYVNGLGVNHGKILWAGTGLTDASARLASDTAVGPGVLPAGKRTKIPPGGIRHIETRKPQALRAQTASPGRTPTVSSKPGGHND